MERQILTDARTVFAHDFDGVHYSYGLFTDVVDFYGSVNAEVTSKILPITFDDAKALNRKSYEATGDGFQMAIDIGQTHGHDPAELRRHLDIEYHKTLLIRIREQMPALLAPCAETIGHFESMHGSIAHGVISQGHAGEWVSPILVDHKTIGFFPPGSVMGYADFGYENKAVSDLALRTFQKFFGAKPEEMVFLEDSPKNLKRGKEYSEKLMTVFIHHGKPFETLPDYIDMQAPTLRHFFAEVAKVQSAPKIRRPSLILPEPVPSFS